MLRGPERPSTIEPRRPRISLAANSFDTVAAPVRVAKKHGRLVIKDAEEIPRLERPASQGESSDGMIFASDEFKRGVDGLGAR